MRSISEIRDACNEVATTPETDWPINHLDNLVSEAKAQNYALAFHVGNDLAGKPYIQGYTLTENTPAD